MQIRTYPDPEPDEMAGYRNLVFAVIRQAYLDAERYYKHTAKGREYVERAKEAKQAQEYRESIAFFFSPVKIENVKYRSYMTYLLDMVGREEDMLIKKILKKVKDIEVKIKNREEGLRVQ